MATNSRGIEISKQITARLWDIQSPDERHGELVIYWIELAIKTKV